MEQKNSKKTMSFTRMDRMVLESYKTLCEGLANYLGDGYEIVLHSLENYDNSVIKIINGYYTGRKEGAPITDLALHMLEDIRHNNGKDYIAYYSKNKKGEPGGKGLLQPQKRKDPEVCYDPCGRRAAADHRAAVHQLLSEYAACLRYKHADEDG